MARNAVVVRVFSAQTVGTDATQTSEAFPIGRAEYATCYYEIDTTTTPKAISGTASLVVCTKENGTFLAPRDGDGNDLSTLFQIDSVGRAVDVDFPLYSWGKITLQAGSANGYIVRNFWVTTDEV